MSGTMIHRETTGDGCGWKIFRRKFFDEIEYDLCEIEHFTLYPKMATFTSEDLDSSRRCGLPMGYWMSVDELDKAAIAKAKWIMSHA